MGEGRIDRGLAHDRHRFSEDEFVVEQCLHPHRSSSICFVCEEALDELSFFFTDVDIVSSASSFYKQSKKK